MKQKNVDSLHQSSSNKTSQQQMGWKFTQDVQLQSQEQLLTQQQASVCLYFYSLIFHIYSTT